jgi:hypothetical protein
MRFLDNALWSVVKLKEDPCNVLMKRELVLKEQSSVGSIEYELKSCVLHQGESLFKGHYTARGAKDLCRLFFCR